MSGVLQKTVFTYMQRQKERVMYNILYIIGAIVVIVVVLRVLGLM